MNSRPFNNQPMHPSNNIPRLNGHGGNIPGQHNLPMNSMPGHSSYGFSPYGMGMGMGGLGGLGGLYPGSNGIVGIFYGINAMLMSVGQLMQLVGANSQYFSSLVERFYNIIHSCNAMITSSTVLKWLRANRKRSKLLSWLLVFLSMSISAIIIRLLQSPRLKRLHGAAGLLHSNIINNSELSSSLPTKLLGYQDIAKPLLESSWDS